MDGQDELGSLRVAVLGLGLMGGSLALALRDRCRFLSVYDPDPAARALAGEMQLADRIAESPAAALEGCDLLILASPVSAILDTIGQLPSLAPSGGLLLDLGSTKVEIVQAMAGLPEQFDPLGGHPMCGKETRGLVNAELDLFQGAPFALTPLERTSDRARRVAENLTRALAAFPVWMDPVVHDCWVANTSHLPYLVSVALSLATPLEAAPLVGPGFRSTTRLAGSSPGMMLDVLRTNRKNLLESLQRLSDRLDQMKACLNAGDWVELTRLLEEGAERRGFLVGGNKK